MPVKPKPADRKYRRKEYCEQCGTVVHWRKMRSRAWDHIAVDRPTMRELMQRYAEILLLESESLRDACRKADLSREWMEDALARMLGREVPLPGEKNRLPSGPWKDVLTKRVRGVDGADLALRRWRLHRGHRRPQRWDIHRYDDLATPDAKE